MALGVCASSGAASPRMAVVAYDADFSQFVDCHLPTSLTARVNAGDGTGGKGAASIDIVIAQRDVVAGTARVRVGLAV
jgi:hypothetical protein